MDFSEVLAGLDAGGDGGPNLEYEAVFTEMALAAQPGEERQMGDTIVEAEEPDYKRVRDTALAVLEQSKDLRAATLLALAALRLDGFPGFAVATTYTRRCLEEFWDVCHPELDADDDDDPTMRVNAVRGFADRRGILRAIRLAPLTQSRTFGAFTLTDIEIASGEVEPPEEMDNPPEASAVDAAFQDTDAEALSAILEGARTALADIEAIDAKFSEATPGRGPDLDETLRALRKIRDRLAAVVGTEDAAETEEADAAPGEAGEAAAGPRQRGVGEISSNADVLKAIDKIMAYYERYEPSSPVPILLRRAKKLVSADFLTIIRELAPQGMENVELVAGREEEEEEY